MARGRSVGVIQVAFVLAYVALGSSAAVGQIGFDRPDFKVALPGVNVLPGVVATTPAAISLGGNGLNVAVPAIAAPGLISITPTTLSLDRSGVSATVSGVNAANLVTTTPTSASLTGNGLNATVGSLNVVGVVATTPTSASLTRNGLNATVGSLNVAGLVTTAPTSVSLNGGGLNATLPGVNVAGLIATTPAAVSLNKDGATVTLPGIDVAGAAIVTGAALNVPSAPGAGVSASDVLKASSIAQMFAGVGTAEVFAPVEQLLNGLAFGSGGPGCASADASTLAPAQSADVWTWNASTIGRSHHDGYQVSDGDGNACGSLLPFETLERAQLPGILWDASSAFGFKKGTLHMGLSGGAVDSETQVKAGAALRDARLSQAGTARLRSWSIGGFSLLTMDKFYAGSAIGAAWGRAESQNFVAGSDSDYDTSTLVAAGFLGTIVPLTGTVRLDVRGTLSYQRTIGDAHADSLGLVYGDHTIEAADAMLSGRLFGIFRHDGMIIRPYVQAGITHHLSYSNNLEIGGVAFTLREADTTFFTATGLDFEIDRTLQLSVGVRHDNGADTDSVTGRFGLSLRLN